jgi:Tfp pilus assembly protein PilX
MWWEYVLLVLAMVLAVYGFLAMAGFETRVLSSRTSRTAESMYSRYAGSKRQQRKYAKEHGGEWKDDGNSKAA